MGKTVNNLNKSLEESLDLSEYSKTDHTHSNYATTTTTGSLSSLQTSAKGSLVAAINEVFQSGNDAKKGLVDALVAKGQSCSTSDTWSTLTGKISNLVAPAGTAVASNVLTGKTFINSTGSTVTGTMANRGSKTITPSASKQTLGAGYYSGITINGDSNLKASNILSGVTIFGVAGTASKGYTFDSTKTGTLLLLTDITDTFTAGTYETTVAICPVVPGKYKVNVSIMGGRCTAKICCQPESTTTESTLATLTTTAGYYESKETTVTITEDSQIVIYLQGATSYTAYMKNIQISTNVVK